MRTALIGVVIPHYNGLALLRDCLTDLQRQTVREWMVVVVDNGSTDGSQDFVRGLIRHDQRVILVQSDNGHGVAGANNIGTRRCLDGACDWILYLNNDTLLAEDLLERLLQSARSRGPRMGGIAPVIDCANEPTLWFGGGTLNRFRATGMHWRNRPDEETIAITYAPTCCLLVRAEALREVGLFDEKYFMYFDDTDLCTRLLDAGWDLCLLNVPLVQHRVSSSSGGEHRPAYQYYNTRNHWYYAQKYMGPLGLGIFAATFGAKLATRCLRWLLCRRGDLALAACRGLMDGIRQRMGQMKTTS